MNDMPKGATKYTYEYKSQTYTSIYSDTIPVAKYLKILKEMGAKNIRIMTK